MADAPVVMDAANPLLPESGWGVKLRSVGGDATGTVGPHDVRGLSIQHDASAEGTLDELWPEKHQRSHAADIPGLLTQEVLDILDAIESSLLEDRDEALLHGEVCASEPGIATCRRIAIKIAPWLAPSSGLKWAAFGEDTGGVSLVLRSVITDRRVDFTISADGLRISAVSIDENLTARSVPLGVDDRSSLRENAAWVHSRP